MHTMFVDQACVNTGGVKIILHSEKVAGKVLKRDKRMVLLQKPNGETHWYYKGAVLSDWKDLRIGSEVEIWVIDVVKNKPRKLKGLIHKVNLAEADFTVKEIPYVDLEEFFESKDGKKHKIDKLVRKRLPVTVPRIPDIDRMLTECIKQGRYDVAFYAAIHVYTGGTKSLMPENVFFGYLPGASKVYVRVRGNRHLSTEYHIPGLAGEIVYTWWALHGGWHGRSYLTKPFDYKTFMTKVNNPWIAAGLEYFEPSEMTKFAQECGTNSIWSNGLTAESLGKQRYYVYDRVVYFREGKIYKQAGLAHPELPDTEEIPKQLVRWRPFNQNWIDKTGKKLCLVPWLQNMLINQAAKIEERLVS